MKNLKKLILSLSCTAILLSIAIPAFAYDPILGWMTDGTYTGYPYISWTEPGNLWGGVAAQNKNTNTLVDYTTSSGRNNIYVRTPTNKLYSETLYKGYYSYRFN